MTKTKRKVPFAQKNFGIVLTILLLILIAAILLFLIQIGIFTKEKFQKNTPQLFMVQDECSIIVGKLIHTLTIDGACRVKCRAECEVRELKFYNSEFSEYPEACNECKCYCIE